MIRKIFLMWNSYTSNDILTICSLTKVKELYFLKYHSGAIKAQEQGCILPFPYTDKITYFSKLPSFFENRKLNPEVRKRMGIVCENDDLSILVSNLGKKNSDNFFIISDKMHEVLRNNDEEKNLGQKNL